MQDTANYYLDITADVCPMTFVRTKLFIERINAGDVLQIRMKGREPFINVPKSVQELGHDILELLPECTPNPLDIYLLTVRKKG